MGERWGGEEEGGGEVGSRTRLLSEASAPAPKRRRTPRAPTTSATRTSTEGKKVWRTHSRRIRTALGMSPTWRPWTGVLAARLKGLPDSDRFREYLDIVWFDRCLDHSASLGVDPRVLATNWDLAAKLVDGFFVDPSQGIQFYRLRSAKSSSDDYDVGTITQSATIYSFELQLCLNGGHNMALQGLPVGFYLNALKSKNAFSIAGEAFFYPHLVAIVLSFFSLPSGRWWRSAAIQAAGDQTSDDQSQLAAVLDSTAGPVLDSSPPRETAEECDDDAFSSVSLSD